MSNILNSVSYVKSQVHKMDEAIYLTYACMIARLPILLIGNPGTGKSHLSKIFAGMFGERDKDWFYQSITAKTSPEKLFGGLIAEKMLMGIEEYNLSVGAATKTGVIFDELYKSHHPAMMNSLLNFYDENPTIFSGGKNIAPDWQWAINTSNFEDLPEDLKYCPLWDRQGAKLIIPNLSPKDSRDALEMIMNLKKAPKMNPPSLTIEDIELARNEALKFHCPKEIIDKFYDVVLPILEKYAYISQRKITSFILGKPGHPSVLQSLAYVLHCGGDLIIDAGFLAYLPYFCWQDIKTYDALSDALEKALIPPAVKIYNRCIEQVETITASIISGIYAASELEKAKKDLRKVLNTSEQATNGISAKEKSDPMVLHLRKKLHDSYDAATNALKHLSLQSADFSEEIF